LGNNASLITTPVSSAASYIHCFLIQTQLFFFALRAEHGHAVGEFGTGGDLLRPEGIGEVL
jgi:hypothetical protein